MGRQYSVDDLPKYSPWPARIVGLELWTPATKRQQDILREFEAEKWGVLLERARDLGDALSLSALEATTGEPDVEKLVWRAGELQMAREFDARAEGVRTLAETLASHGPIHTLVDMGAGYGGTLFPLFRELRRLGASCSPERVIAGELTQSGQELLGLLAEVEGVEVEVVDCDLAGTHVMEPPPVGATVVTCYSMMYLQSSHTCLDRLVSWKPRLVVHFEPLIQHADCTTMLGLLQRRYIELNGYNQELLTGLRRLDTDRAIEFIEERVHVSGINPLLPASIVVWRPIARG